VLRFFQIQEPARKRELTAVREQERAIRQS